MNSVVLRIVLFLTLFKRFICETSLHHQNELEFGSYQFWHLCQPGEFATGFEIKADVEEKNFSDQQGMTGIRLTCSNKTFHETEEISSQNVNAGTWKGKNMCPSGEWLNGFRIMIQKYSGWVKDDTGANNIEMVCDSNATFNGRGTNRGDWTEWVNCTEGQAICGLRTKTENTFTADKAGIIAVNMMCCNLTGESRTTMDPNFYATFSEYENDLFGPFPNESTFFNNTFFNIASNISSGFDSMFNNSTNQTSTVNRAEKEGGVSTMSSSFDATSRIFVNDGSQNDTRNLNTSGNPSGVDDSFFDSNTTKKGINFPRN